MAVGCITSLRSSIATTRFSSSGVASSRPQWPKALYRYWADHWKLDPPYGDDTAAFIWISTRHQ